MVMETGIVIWFNDAKGFGFVKTEKGDEIICEKWHMTTESGTMKERQQISFNRNHVDGRDVARNISVITNDAVHIPQLSMNEGKVYLDHPLIIVFEDVISPEICQEIINKHIKDSMNPNSGKQSRQESFTQVTEDVENRGISLGMDPYHYNIIARTIVDNCGFPYSNIEAIDIYNYITGQYLDLHHDYPYDPKQINYYSHGGDRVGTGILYLNDDFHGGVTSFPKLGVDIKPKTGSLLYFKQSYDEETNWSTIHESTIVTKGTKWIASCFFSETERIGFTDRSNFVPQENPVFTDPFYIKKFMEIQRGNVQLWRKLKDIEADQELKLKIEQQFGENFFSKIDDLIK
jgi:cold shock CspA family protein